MPVVTAGVHPAGMSARIGQAGLFLDRQGIEIGADGDAPRSMFALQESDDTVATNAGVHLVSPPGEQPGDDLRGSLFLASELRVGVKVAPLLDELINVDGRGKLHQARSI